MRFWTQEIVQIGSICAKIQRNRFPDVSRKKLRAKLHEGTDRSEPAQVEKNSKYHESDFLRSCPESVCATPQKSLIVVGIVTGTDVATANIFTSSDERYEWYSVTDLKLRSL